MQTLQRAPAAYRQFWIATAAQAVIPCAAYPLWRDFSFFASYLSD